MAACRRVASFNLWTILIICLSSSISAQFPQAGNNANQGAPVQPNLDFGRRGGLQLQNDDQAVDRARQQPGAGQGLQFQQQQRYQQPQQKLQPQQNQGQYGQFRQNPNVVPNQNRPYQNQLAQGQHVGAPPKRSSPIKISELPDCSADVKHLCSASSLNNNFAVLDCLQNDVKVCNSSLLVKHDMHDL